MGSAIDYEEVSIIAYLVICAPFFAWLSRTCVSFYAEESTPTYGYTTLYIGFFCTFMVIFIVPIDIACVCALRKLETDPYQHYHRDRSLLLTLYESLYLIVLLWANLVLCFMEYYVTDGYFTNGTRAWSSLKRLLIDYIPIVVAGGPALGIILGLGICPPTSSGLNMFSKIATNTAYEMLLMFLIGFGLVEYPRLLWNNGDLSKLLKKQQIKAATEFTSNLDAQMALGKLVANVLKTKEKMTSSDPALKEAMSILSSECPSEFRSSKLGEVASDKDGNITIHTLSALRTKLNTAKSVYRMAQARLEATQIGAYDLEDLVKAKESNANVIHWSLKNADSTPEECKWLVRTRPSMYKALASFLAIVSIFSFLGVVGSMSEHTLPASVYFYMVHSPTASPSVAGITIAVWLQMFYAIVVTVWALFQLRSLGLELVPHRTTPIALSFGCRLVMGLSFPLCFFYLTWIGESGLVEGDWMFVKIAGRAGDYFMPPSFAVFYPMASIPFIKETFGTLFPMLLFMFLFAILSQAWNRLMILVKMPHMQFGDPIVSEAQLAEGMKQLTRFRKIAERTIQRKELTKRRQRMGTDGEDEDKGLKVCGIWIRKPKPKEIKRKNSLTSSEVSGMIKFPPPKGVSGSASFKAKERGRVKLVWRDIFLIVKAPGILYFCANEDASESDPPLSDPDLPAPIPLAIVMDFSFNSKRDKDGYRLLLSLVDETIKIRFDGEEEVFYWKKRLIEWKDHAVLLDNIGSNVKADKLEQEGDGEDDADDELLAEFGDIEMGFMTENPLRQKEDAEEKDASQSRISTPVARGKGESVAVISDDKDKDKNAAPSGFEDLATKLKKEQAMTPEQKRETKALGKRLAQLHKRTDVDALKAPPTKEGWLMKKRRQHVTINSLKFQHRYFRIDAGSQTLRYYLTNFDGEEHRGEVDLRLAEEITMFTKEVNGDEKDDTRFNVICDEGGRVMKLKAETKKEALQWVDSLNQWRDYTLIRHANSHYAHIAPSEAATSVRSRRSSKLGDMLLEKGLLDKKTGASGIISKKLQEKNGKDSTNINASPMSEASLAPETGNSAPETGKSAPPSV